MKKKKLLKKIYQLEEINEYLGLQNIRLRMKLAGTCTQEEAKGTILERTKEPESKEQNDKRREGIRLNRYCHINDALDAMTGGIWSPETKKEEKTEPAKAQKPIAFPEVKTEGPESESELKENELPERWAIKSNKDNIGEIDKYYSRQLKYSLYKDYVGEYFHSHNLADDSLSVMNDDIDFASNFNSEEIKHGYAEITFDQFKEHVLKENTISLEVGKKYITRDGESFECKELTSTGRYRLENDLCRLYYEENGKLPGGAHGDYDLVSEVKERKTIGQLEAERRQAYDHPF